MSRTLEGEEKNNCVAELNKLGFLSSVMIDLIDKLSETNLYKKELKMYLKRVLIEVEKLNTFHYKAYQDYGMLRNGDTEKEGYIHSLDVYNVTSKAYQELFDLFANCKPSDVVMMLEHYKNLTPAKKKKMGVKYEPALRTYEKD